MSEPSSAKPTRSDAAPVARRPIPGFWDKLDILLKPLGSLATAAVVAFIGYLGSDILQARQQTNAKVQLYAQIMSSREAAETGLRREMFNSIIQTFLDSDDKSMTPGEALEQRILAVQLLTYNFHDALDLGPLFKFLERQAALIYADASDDRKAALDLLKRTARDVISKQVAVLESDGQTKEATFTFSNSERGQPRINEVLSASPQANNSNASHLNLPPKQFRLEMLSWDGKRDEIQVRLKVTDPNTSKVEFDEIFWVGSFDFPLIDNTRLIGGGRCAVVLQKFTFYPAEENASGEMIHGDAKLNLIYFPGSRASLKSKPYYDELFQEAIGTNGT